MTQLPLKDHHTPTILITWNFSKILLQTESMEGSQSLGYSCKALAVFFWILFSQHDSTNPPLPEAHLGEFSH